MSGTLPPIDPRLVTGCGMGDLVLRALSRGGERVAFIHGERQITYRQFAEQLSRFIQALKAAGLRRGDAIATLSMNRPEAFLTNAATYVMGLRMTWMHPLGSEDDHAYMLEDSGVTHLFVDPDSFTERAEALRRRVPGLQRIYSFGPAGFDGDMLAAAERFAAAPLAREAEASDICTLIYTGGTTGRPKGVVHDQRVQVMMVLHELAEWDWPQEVRFLAMTPITHAAGAIILPVLLKGGTFVMNAGFSPDKFIDLVERHRITATFVVPTMIYVLLDHPRLEEADLSSLRLMIYGAAPMAPARLEQGIGRFGPIFMQLYGQSEAPNAVTALRCFEHDPVNHPERLASCGLPIGTNEVRLLDDALDEVPVGEVGEICVRGPLVMLGYWNKPEETEKVFRGGWLHTGDLARRDADGYIYIVDRAKDMIISGGFNVYPREVEDALTRHPAVAAAAVIGVPDDKWGEAVKAVVVLHPGAEVHAQELIGFVREAKGAVQAPKSVDFVDSLPVTGLGKPDKKALRARYWGGTTRAVN